MLVCEYIHWATSENKVFSALTHIGKRLVAYGRVAGGTPQGEFFLPLPMLGLDWAVLLLNLNF